MNKYIYCESTQDYWPEINTIMANSYNDAFYKVAKSYADHYDDDKIMDLDDYEDFREYMNDQYTIALSDIEEIDEL